MKWQWITQPALSLSHNLLVETQQELGAAGLTTVWPTWAGTVLKVASCQGRAYV